MAEIKEDFCLDGYEIITDCGWKFFISKYELTIHDYCPKCLFTMGAKVEKQKIKVFNLSDERYYSYSVCPICKEGLPKGTFKISYKQGEYGLEFWDGEKWKRLF